MKGRNERVLLPFMVVSAFLILALFCGEEKEIGLVQVEVLPGVCLPVPRGFSRIHGFGRVPTDRFVFFELFGMRYPEELETYRISSEAEGIRVLLGNIRSHCNCEFEEAISGFSTQTQEIRFYDFYAETNARAFAKVTTIEGQRYLVYAYCLAVRDYCPTLKEIVSQLRPCSEVEAYLPVSQSMVIPTVTPRGVLRKKPIRRVPGSDRGAKRGMKKGGNASDGHEDGRE